jgi:hypothetical protein
MGLRRKPVEPARPVNAEKLICEALSEASGEAESKRIIHGKGPMNNPGQGLDRMRIDEILHACVADRAAAVRKYAFREIVIAVPLRLFAAWVLSMAFVTGTSPRQGSAKGILGEHLHLVRTPW